MIKNIEKKIKKQLQKDNRLGVKEKELKIKQLI